MSALRGPVRPAVRSVRLPHRCLAHAGRRVPWPSSVVRTPFIGEDASSSFRSMTTSTAMPGSAAVHGNVDLEHYRPFLLSPIPGAERVSLDREELAVEPDWTGQVAEDLQDAKALGEAVFGLRDEGKGLKVLVLYGSMRERSYSRLMAFEAARLLHHLGCDVRVYSPAGLPMKDDTSDQHPKVQELRKLSEWSEAQFWCSPEQHGNITAVMKNQIDWIPLSLGSVRPTQGRTLAFAQVNGGSQSFNTVNTLRILGRWMRMHVIPNQSSLPLAWKAFTPAGRLMPSSNRDRLVDVCEELVKVSAIVLPHRELLDDRWSERDERRKKGRLLSQAEKEREREAAARAEAKAKADTK